MVQGLIILQKLSCWLQDMQHRITVILKVTGTAKSPIRLKVSNEVLEMVKSRKPGSETAKGA